ncbi:hypothetical protein [Mesorhizobium sp. M0478]|uniref:hypothetical protein n=1 Tax=Mesorhizobium sp. M0478 TaxID=2956947 RepID=UPI0033365450
MDERFVFGYHGTSSDRADAILKGSFEAKPREGSWLGVGQYFFYRGEEHAADWAAEVSKRPKPVAAGAHPVVLECTIDLENCINLLDNTHWDNLRQVALRSISSPIQLSPQALYEVPRSPDLGRNVDDYKVMNAYIAAVRSIRPVTSIIAAFIEGHPIHDRSWLFDQSHVCISALTKDVISLRKRTDL